jgi:DNA-binding winged helix-turn-helix (wHTH) protein
MRVHFGEFALDLGSRELLRGERRVHLSPKAFQLLAELVASRPRALAKADLQRRLWPDTFVAEANVANLAGEVRAALGDAPRHPRFLRTVQRYGYAFCGEVREEGEATPPGRPSPPQVRCRLIWSGGRITLDEGEHVLGRSRELEACLDAPSVSRRHARLRLAEGEATLEDLGSKNGTFVKGQRLTAPARLSDGDEFRLGSLRLKFRRLGPDGSTETGSRA